MCKSLNNELPYGFLVEFQDKLRMAEEKFRNINDVKVKINGLLRELALFYEADCAFVLEIDWELGIGFASFTYCSEGVLPVPQTIQSLHLNRLDGWARKLRNNQPVIIDMERVSEEVPETDIEAVWSGFRYLMLTPFMKHLNTGAVVIGNPKIYRENLSFLSVLASMIVSDLNEIKLQERFDVVIKRVLQQTEEDVYINCFGGMEIRCNKGILTDENITADQCYRLLAYLIFNRKKTKPVRELADIIWNEVPMEDPYKDVKNVVYRLKRFLGIIELDDLVIGMSGTFVINPKYQLHMDFERFEDICNKYFKEKDPVVQNQCFQIARQLYKGTLLPKCDHIHWFIPRIGYYQSMYLQLLKDYLSKKLKEEDYLTVQRIALDGLNDEPYDSDFMMYEIICMFQLGNRSIAKSYYSKMKDELTEEQRTLIHKYRR